MLLVDDVISLPSGTFLARGFSKKYPFQLGQLVLHIQRVDELGRQLLPHLNLSHLEVLDSHKCLFTLIFSANFKAFLETSFR